MSAITTHVLDISSGRPAEGIVVRLSYRNGSGWAKIGDGSTDADGRIGDLLTPGYNLSPGEYRLEFDTGDYHTARGQSGFYPTVIVTFRVDEAREHYHVPLLLSPYGYSTYRGS